MYSSKIFDIVGHHLPQINCYTDDSGLYLSFNPSYAFSQDETIRSMETCISDVQQWMTSDKLMLHDDKTEFIVIASRHLFKKAAVNTIRVEIAVITFLKFIVMQMTPSFIYRLTQVVLLESRWGNNIKGNLYLGR